MRGNYSWMANRVNIDILYINPFVQMTCENKHNLEGLEGEIFFRFLRWNLGLMRAGCIGLEKGIFA